MVRFRSFRAAPPLPSSPLPYSYGICAEENRGDGWRVVAIIPDISCDGVFATKLAEKCTRGQLSPVHLLDVVEDFLLHESGPSPF